ncbi:MAG: endonuclease V [Candidatus Marinimicrobia bacterium]|nr:endonuclease V [Candidatus Neomarinimicrobiota bacterium]MCF7828142.1 endonuclease V [Candidatus Neomarinimicrobiota bacterium]MCF7879683.1 endonuclease V [Candidatus Neomarinimicrobiota bacterium]
MTVDRNHPWDLSPADAIHLQQEIKELIVHHWDNREVRTIAGADVSYIRRWQQAFAVIALFEVEYGSSGIILHHLKSVTDSREITYPYIPGLLVFREGPALESVWQRLEKKPDLLMFDGAGIAHPRRCGLAAHLGWRWNIPAIGCAKSRLTGEAEEVGIEKGAHVPLFHKKTQIGNVVRTRTRVKPLYVSPGHLMDFETAVDWTLQTTTKYKLPKPTRIADNRTKKLVREYQSTHET